MKTLVAWSGGLDSTALINHLLKSGDCVESLYIEIPANGEKTKREQDAIQKISKYFNNYSFSHIGTTVINPMGGSILCLKQPMLWLTGLLYALTSNYDCVSIGYVSGDCAISYLTEIKSIWDSFSGLTDRKLPPLTFPMIKEEKIYLWRDLPDDIKPYVTWCESPEYITKPCGECHPCKRAAYEGITIV